MRNEGVNWIVWRGLGKGYGLGVGGGVVGEEGERGTPIFIIRGEYSKYIKHYVIILFVE